jgi:hypothetical protein
MSFARLDGTTACWAGGSWLRHAFADRIYMRVPGHADGLPDSPLGSPWSSR